MYSNLERERERENKRRKQENLAPLNDGGVGSSSSSLGFSPRYAISWLDIIFLLYSSSSFLFFYPWLLMIRQQGPQISERRMVHFMNKSESVHQRLRLPFMLHQGQVLWLSCFSAAGFFFSACVLLGTNHHLKTPVGFGLDWNCFFSFFRWGVVAYPDRSNRSIIFP